MMGNDKIKLVNNGFVSKDIFKEEVNKLFENEEECFKNLTSLNDKELNEYKELLSDLERLSKLKSDDKHKRGKITKEKGKVLETIVNFIIKKSTFFDVYKNVPISTNEIDQVITISYKGRRIMDATGITTGMLGIEGNYFLGECKNYDKKVGSTWVGKFYTLLRVCGGCRLGIIFSYNGLSGEEDKWYDSHGLTKILYQLSSDGGNIFILDFNYKDFKKIAEGKSFIELIKEKKISLQTGAKVENFSIPHEKTDEIRETVKDLPSI
jgi:hypothetical protein